MSSSAPDLEFIMTAMTEYLSTEQLKGVLLKAIPMKEMRTFQPATPAGRPGLRQQPRAPLPVVMDMLDPAYSGLFVKDTDALEYLEMIREVVEGEARADSLQFLLEEYDEYFAKGVERVPDFFRPVLILFKRWHERSGRGDNPGMDVDAGHETPHHGETSAAHAGGAGANPLGRTAALLARMQALG